MPIKIENTEYFFTRGKSIASLADQGMLEKESRIVSFEHAEDLARVVSAAKIDLFRTIRSHSGSITDISKRLNRDRSAVKRDIDVLQSIGLLNVQTMKNAGHGTKKEVVVCDKQVFMAW
jgi:predicted transcriptional regulator